MLQLQGILTKTKMDKIKAKIKSYFLSLTRKKIKLKTKLKINFLEQLSNLVNAGIPLSNALKIISFQTKDKNLKYIISSISENLNNWTSLKDSMIFFRETFNDFDISLVEVWEITGKLWESLITIKEKEEKSSELKSKIIWALIYPMVIIFLSLSMIAVFMIYVIPKIEKMYKDAKVNLPGLTQSVIATSNFLQNNIFYIIILLVIAVIVFNFTKRIPRLQLYYDTIIFKIPFFGNLIKKKTLTLFSNILSTLLSNGVIINKSLQVTLWAIENTYFKKEIAIIIEGVSKGQDLSRLMGIENISKWKEHPLFPLELASIIKIWEQTGNMADLLWNIWKKFNKELDTVIKNIQTAIEPIVIIWVWVIIGTIIMAIMLPFFNMVNVI